MARSSLKIRQEAMQDRIARYDACLKKPRTPVCVPAADAIARSIEAEFQGCVVRAAELWKPRLKTRDPGRIALYAARHLFASYAVPAHLEDVWLSRRGLTASEERERKFWYITAAGGHSVYKRHTQGLLSRKESHVFLHPPRALSFEEALWFAMARSATEDVGVALRIARSRLSQFKPGRQPFFREMIQFFASNGVALHEMDDLVDYLMARHRENAGYSLKGRTLVSLRRQMAQWHRELGQIRRVGDAKWDGLPLPDWHVAGRDAAWPGGGGTFAIVQLRTAAELVAEGQAQHHCVASYLALCLNGTSAIFSLRQKDGGSWKRLLTLELSADRRMVQVRGFANRPASAGEKRLLDRWSAEFGVQKR